MSASENMTARDKIALRQKLGITWEEFREEKRKQEDGNFNPMDVQQYRKLLDEDRAVKLKERSKAREKDRKKAKKEEKKKKKKSKKNKSRDSEASDRDEKQRRSSPVRLSDFFGGSKHASDSDGSEDSDSHGEESTASRRSKESKDSPPSSSARASSSHSSPNAHSLKRSRSDLSIEPSAASDSSPLAGTSSVAKRNRWDIKSSDS